MLAPQNATRYYESMAFFFLYSPAGYLKNSESYKMIIRKIERCYLLIFNKWVQNWELPGGIINDGETPRECAERELLEETNQTINQLSFKGIMKFKLKPNDRLEYGALYSGEIHDIKPFKKNEEAEQIVLRDRVNKIGYIDEIDEKLLEYY